MSPSQKQVSINIKLHPKQSKAFTTDATELFYGGATRGGKSYLVRAALIAWCHEIPNLQCKVFRRYYDDVIENHMQGPSSFRIMLAPFVQQGLVKITETEIRWSNGSLISLDHLDSDDALEKHQGNESHVLVFEECCQILEHRMRFLRAWCTMSNEMKGRLPERYKGRFPRILYTGNPIGVSAPYFRRNFVKAAPESDIWHAPDDEGGFLRQYIEAKVEDNPSEDAAAVRRRVSGMGDEAASDALLNANWDAQIGDYFPQYDEKRHVTPDFYPPEHWFKFRTFDWGSAEPACCYWWAVSDGVEFFDDKARRRWFPAGALVAYREWYICNKTDPAKGTQMRNEDIAGGIVLRTPEKTSGLTITDSKPFQDVGMSKASKKYKIADVFAEAGCPLTLGNLGRVNGWAQLRDRLIGRDGFPLIFFTEGCKYLRDYLPALGRSDTNPEDAASDGEATHSCDCARYAATTRPLVTERKILQPPSFERTITPQAILSHLNQRSSTRYGVR